MSRRTKLTFTLSILVLSGLVAGLFTGSIEKVLGKPQGIQMMTNTQQTQGKTNTPAANPQGTPPINNNQPNQPKNVLAADTFQRQNQPLWGTASDGRQWAGDANIKPSFSINGWQGQIAQGQGVLEAVIGMPTNNVDITISANVNQFGDNVNLGVVARWTNPNNWYKALIDGNRLRILKSVNGQLSAIAQIDVKISAGVAQTIRFRTLGTMLFAKVWPSGTPEPAKWMIVANDPTFSTGKIGIRVLTQPTTVINLMSFNAVTASIGNTI